MDEWTPVSSAENHARALRKDIETIRRALVDSKPADGSLQLLVAELLSAVLVDVSTLQQAIDNCRFQIEHDTTSAQRAQTEASQQLERLTRDLATWRERATERAARIDELNVEFRALRDNLRRLDLTPAARRSKPGRYVAQVLSLYSEDVDA